MEELECYGELIIPTRLLFDKERYKNLTPESVIIYCIMVNRAKCATFDKRKNMPYGIDENGKIYCIYPNLELAEELGLEEEQIIKDKKLLAEDGLIVEKQFTDKPNQIYFLNNI